MHDVVIGLVVIGLLIVAVVAWAAIHCAGVWVIDHFEDLPDSIIGIIIAVAVIAALGATVWWGGFSYDLLRHHHSVAAAITIDMGIMVASWAVTYYIFGLFVPIFFMWVDF